jgi:hypothetical protein
MHVQRQRVTVTVVDADQYDGDFPLSKIANSVPAEYRAIATLELDSVYSYGDSHYAHIKVAYTRPETDEEMGERKQRARLKEEQQRDKELAVLAALKAKYPAT